MTNEEQAALLATVLPLLSDWTPRKGDIGWANGWKWRSRLDLAEREFLLVAERGRVTNVKDACAALTETVTFGIGTIPDGAIFSLDVARAAIKLAVSRLYDGPQAAPAPAEPARPAQPKVALCDHGGCSQLRTHGTLCKTHADREERAAEAQVRAVLDEPGTPAPFLSAAELKPIIGIDPGARDYKAAVVWSGPAGAMKIEAVAVNERGQVTAAVPIDPVVTTQPRPQCRTPGCKAEPRWAGEPVLPLDPWCGYHGQEAMSTKWMFPHLAPKEIRTRLDREKTASGGGNVLAKSPSEGSSRLGLAESLVWEDVTGPKTTPVTVRIPGQPPLKAQMSISQPEAKPLPSASPVGVTKGKAAPKVTPLTAEEVCAIADAGAFVPDRTKRQAHVPAWKLPKGRGGNIVVFALGGLPTFRAPNDPPWRLLQGTVTGTYWDGWVVEFPEPSARDSGDAP
jgi:hypothetical protein